jgi:hypothetical protein
MTQNSWRPAAGVAWVVERTVVTLVRAERPVTTLSFPEGALWDLLTRGYTARRLSVLMAALLVCREEVAAAYVGDVIERWRSDGLVEGEAWPTSP